MPVNHLGSRRSEGNYLRNAQNGRVVMSAHSQTCNTLQTGITQVGHVSVRGNQPQRCVDQQWDGVGACAQPGNGEQQSAVLYSLFRENSGWEESPLKNGSLPMNRRTSLGQRIS